MAQIYVAKKANGKTVVANIDDMHKDRYLAQSWYLSDQKGAPIKESKKETKTDDPIKEAEGGKE